MSKNRIEKINSELLRAISDIINNKLKDPRISGLISVLSINTSADLKHADVALSIFNSDEKKAEETFEALNNSAGFIRGELSRELDLRTVPQLHFTSDNSIAYSQKISRLIEDLNNESK